MQTLRTSLSLQKSFSTVIASILKPRNQREVSLGIHGRSIATRKFGAEEKKLLMDHFPIVVGALKEKGKKLNISDITDDWVEKILPHNCLRGKTYKLFSIVFGYLDHTEEVSEEKLHSALMVGWSIEMITATYIILDDIIDNSSVRRGKTAWYKTNNLGNKAITDAALLQSLAYRIFGDNLRHNPNIGSLIKVLHDVQYMTWIGQFMDLSTCDQHGKPKLDQFSMEMCNLISKYKTAYATTVLPVHMALHLSGVSNPELLRRMEKVLLILGILYQTENDFNDCYNDEIDHDRGDIEEGKCSWFIAKALQKVNTDQRKILEDCYGKPSPNKIQAVKDLYDKLELKQEYFDHARKTHQHILLLIDELSTSIPEKVCRGLFNMAQTIVQIK